MKKIIALGLALVIMATTVINVFAAPANFWRSPSGVPAPILIDFKPHNPECAAKLVITPYADRHTMSPWQIALIDKAYDTIVNAKSLTELNAQFAALVAQRGIDNKALAVTHLFDIHYVGCDYHEEHRGFDIILSVDVLHNFVGLLHMNQNEVWELVSDAHIEQNEEHLVFSVDAFSPFAIVVDTTGITPPTGDTAIIVYSIIMVTAAAALVYVLIKRKNQIAE